MIHEEVYKCHICGIEITEPYWCHNCGKTVCDDHITATEYDVFCNVCAVEIVTKCKICGEVLRVDELKRHMEDFH